MNQHYRYEKEESLETLTAFALGELRRQRNTSDITEHLCKRTGWHWEEAGQFLESVRVDNRFQLEAHKNRLYIPISLLMIAGGILNITIFYFWAFFNPRSGKFILPNDMENWILILSDQFFRLLIQFPIVYFFYSLVLTGIGMIIGGVIGIVRSFWRIVVLPR